MKNHHIRSCKHRKTETNYPEEKQLYNRKTKRGRKNLPRLFVIFFITLTMLLSPIGTMLTLAVGVPLLIAPLDGVTTAASPDVPDSEYHPPLGIPELSWHPVEGATSYRVQVSRDIAFTSTVVNTVTTNTAHTPTDARNFADGTWYWRVRVERPRPVGEYSEVRSFTKQWSAVENRPEGLSPDDEIEIDFINEAFTFSWSPVMGAARYKLQIYSSPEGWANPTYTATTLATTHQPKDKLANGTYYWRVLPVDPGNRDGMPSEQRTFVVKYNPELTLLEPTNNATPTFTPTFRWTAVEGARYYQLQYSTDDTFGTSTSITTRNTTYTPTSTLPNDVNYYWRVRVHSGNSVSDWTESRTFIKKWNIQPVLLTPTNNYQHQRFPLFSWTPVPGASYYRVEVSKNSGFSPLYDSGITSNTFYSLSKHDIAEGTHFWRVTPFDGNGNQGLTSQTASFTMDPSSISPHQVYPPFYYPPHEEHNLYEDRTVPYPIFNWHRLFYPSGDSDQGQIYSNAYRLRVTTDSNCISEVWEVDTENMVVTPTQNNPFIPLNNTDYFWCVSALDQIGGSPTGPWSQVWKTRINPDYEDYELDHTTGDVPVLIRPTAGFEFAEMTPLLEWFPMEDADAYVVQISLDENFNEDDIVDQATVPYPAYAPTQSLAQRSLGAVDFGVFYWRVRESSNNAWSATGRFQIAAQSQWQYTRTLGSLENRLQIGSSTNGNPDPEYELTSLQAAQSDKYWFFGFDIPEYSGVDVSYALYLDIDQQVGSGATFDALGYDVTTIPAYQPEYAIYILQQDGLFSSDMVEIYPWNGVDWGTRVLLSSIGGDLFYEDGYIEIQVPNTAIGTSGSYTVSLLSLPNTSPGFPKDAVPSVPDIATTGIITRFANVTERLNLILPPNDAGVDPTTFPSVQPFFWDWPVQAPWSGIRGEVHLDSEFTNEVASFVISASAYHARPFHAWANDLQGNNTYYWRVQPRYRVGNSLLNGAWSQGWRFERQGFIPQNLEVSVDFATPTFSWDQVEGAEFYELQVSGPNSINISTRQNTYTGLSTLANGTYSWQVRVRRRGGIINDWSAPQIFELNLPTPELLSPEPGTLVNRAPTFCWAPIIESAGSPGVPVLTAWKYRVQVSQDPSFSSIFDNIDTEQTCWTPTKGYADGTYYWRVAMIDGNGRLGAYSDPETFTKQYPITTLISPEDGEAITSTPTFIWTPVDGAARYRLEVSKFESFSPTVDAITTNNTRFTSTKAYELDQIYYWRVAIIDANGNQGPFNDSIIISDIINTYLPLIINK